MTAEGALGFIPPEVSRAPIGAPLSAVANGSHNCLDDRGAEYSEGAVVPIKLEPGRMVRCTGGQWTDRAPTGVPANPFVEMEVTWPNGPTPRLKVRPGQMASIRIGASDWGLVPTFDDADPAGIRVEIYDLKAEPRHRLTELVATSNGPAVTSETTPAFTVRVVSSKRSR